MLKISERKNTTEKALEELETLVKSFDGKFEKDIDTVESPEFFVKVQVNNGLNYGDFNFKSWVNYSARWEISEGILNIKSIGEDGESHRYHEVDIIDFKQVNFSDCIFCLKKVLERYNAETKKKDEQIEKFLKFCAYCEIAKQN